MEPYSPSSSTVKSVSAGPNIYIYTYIWLYNIYIYIHGGHTMLHTSHLREPTCQLAKVAPIPKVNSMDAVPRLSPWTLGRLAKEVSECAANSGTDLDEDMQHYVERLSSIWAPRVRCGLWQSGSWFWLILKGSPKTPFFDKWGGLGPFCLKKTGGICVYLKLFKYR